ncbi:MAG TPA: MarR family transcriptional regulator [Sporichthyaceae bacterium]|jgi:DNA-binding MarR family transcriptional regulator|nr:MarR family transcriptional regulator [Sporichthyaceae bacterium]
MPVQQDVDSIEWMRAQWQERGEPAPARLAAMTSVMRANVIMTEVVERALKKLKLTRSGYLVLITLQLAPNSERPMGQLSKSLLVNPTTMTLIVDQLEKAKLVTRQPNLADRRTVLARLTAKGLRTTREASAALAEIGFGVGDLDERTTQRLVDDLRTLRRGLGDQG